MPTIVIETEIAASVERCFDAARDIGLHTETVAGTQERAVAGVTQGLIGPGQSVTFEAVHFGIRQRFTSAIVEFEPPTRFVDEMTKGVFRSFRHVHEFVPQEAGTLMRDQVSWVSPLGLLGRIADVLFLTQYLTYFIRQRGILLKHAVEREAAGEDEPQHGT